MNSLWTPQHAELEWYVALRSIGFLFWQDGSGRSCWSDLFAFFFFIFNNNRHPSLGQAYSLALWATLSIVRGSLLQDRASVAATVERRGRERCSKWIDEFIKCKWIEREADNIA